MITQYCSNLIFLWASLEIKSCRHRIENSVSGFTRLNMNALRKTLLLLHCKQCRESTTDRWTIVESCRSLRLLHTNPLEPAHRRKAPQTTASPSVRWRQRTVSVPVPYARLLSHSRDEGASNSGAHVGSPTKMIQTGCALVPRHTSVRGRGPPSRQAHNPFVLPRPKSGNQNGRFGNVRQVPPLQERGVGATESVCPLRFSHGGSLT